jgi:hypothetical protein
MTLTGALIIVVLVVFIAFGVVLSRSQSATKKAAIADLQKEKEALGTIDLRALARDEAVDLGLFDIPGSQEVSPVVLLKIWKGSHEVRANCPSQSDLRFQIAEGIDPGLATLQDVSLVCDADPIATDEDLPNP